MYSPGQQCEHRIVVGTAQAVLKVRPGAEAGVTKRPNLLMTAGIGLTQRDGKKELLYGLMGAHTPWDTTIISKTVIKHILCGTASRKRCPVLGCLAFVLVNVVMPPTATEERPIIYNWEYARQSLKNL